MGDQGAGSPTCGEQGAANYPTSPFGDAKDRDIIKAL